MSRACLTTSAIERVRSSHRGIMVIPFSLARDNRPDSVSADVFLFYLPTMEESA